LALAPLADKLGTNKFNLTRLNVKLERNNECGEWVRGGVREKERED
jgi:hypothetical protein